MFLCISSRTVRNDVEAVDNLTLLAQAKESLNDGKEAVEANIDNL